MPKISIVFRGLLVLNEHLANGHKCMEIGILNEPQLHKPRIMTFRNGVREDTFLLDMSNGPVLWKLEVDNPVTPGTTLRQHGTGPINRMDTSTPDDDFRWILNLENAEFPYRNIEQRFGLDRTDLKRIVRVTSGEFYTRLKSPLLRRKENNGTPVDFGAIAGVIGLDINVHSGGAKLTGATPNDVIFQFSSDPNVMYEFSNSPADIVTAPADHFPHYYEIFRTQPGQKFGFVRKPPGHGNAPGPNPALCGKVFLGEFSGSLEPPSGATSGPNTGPGITQDESEHHHHEESEHPHDKQDNPPEAHYRD
ncbi:MAG TPA: hypothetical protein VHH35_09545 [Pyrinomonadaceae bacterium]|nr:hypothetical protein [Pyrinomonadaceae bacterium]